MKKFCFVLLFVSLVLCMCACSEENPYLNQCEDVLKQLHAAEAIHYSIIDESETWEYWSCGEDYVGKMKETTISDNITWDVYCTGESWHYQGLYGWYRLQNPYSVKVNWDSPSFDFSYYQFVDAKETDDGLCVSFSIEGSSDRTMVFRFSNDGKFVNMEYTHIRDGNRIYGNVIYDFDKSACKQVIDEMYNVASTFMPNGGLKNNELFQGKEHGVEFIKVTTKDSASNPLWQTNDKTEIQRILAMFNNWYMSENVAEDLDLYLEYEIHFDDSLTIHYGSGSAAANGYARIGDDKGSFYLPQAFVAFLEGILSK